MWMVASLALASGASGCALGTALDSGPGAGERVQSRTGWIGAHGGPTVADTLVIGQGLTVEGDDTISGGFGVAAHYRSPRIDVGGVIEHIGGFRFKGFGRTFPTGDQLRVAATLRWRFAEVAWGSSFLRISPGVSALSHSEALRFHVADQLFERDDEASTEEISEVTAGFSFGIDVGLLVYATERVAVSATLGVLTTLSSVPAFDTSLDYASLRAMISVGLEWQL